ncbi:hypothetical protein DID73_00245 [Candidatus Marinamargulisbacteria bacterium SCGC AG-343-K17]|nr:hypothetical protein DID73_00245 [Candidatus Marinamargulisbacteria bacterium SCGC AG-343-K17]
MKVLILLIVLTHHTFAMIFPIISFSEETGTMAGLFVQRPIAEKSDLQLFLLSQKKGQAGFINTTNIPFGNERVNIKVYGANTGKSFYGIGNTSKKETSNNLYFDELSTTISMEKPLYKAWDMLLGANYNYYKENLDKNNHAQLFSNLSDIGIILGVQMDTRDKEFNSTSGYFNEIKAVIYNNHQILSNDVRYFHPWMDGVLATKFYSVETYTNNDHIQYLTGIGNYYFLRGYQTNDIIDRHLTYGQLEWRRPLTSWFIISPFIEAGVIGRNISNLKKSLFSYGLGGYFPIGSGSFRVESAYTHNNSEFYFGFNHVF